MSAQHAGQGRAARKVHTAQHAARTGRTARTAQHGTARTHRAARWTAGTLLVLGVLLCVAWAHGHTLRQQAVSECLPGVTPYATGHMHFNPCATLDTTQAQDRRADAVVPRWTDGVAVCIADDGSTPGQVFPCRWDSRYQDNGQGGTYTLDRPAS
jgi:hypothetical protein